LSVGKIEEFQQDRIGRRSGGSAPAKRLNVFHDVFANLKDAKAGKLKLFFEALLGLMTEEEKAKFTHDCHPEKICSGCWVQA
jgi:hypothetical protein